MLKNYFQPEATREIRRLGREFNELKMESGNNPTELHSV